MASYKDEAGNEWRVRLDAISLAEIKADHGIDLVDLEHDPLRKVINDGRILAAILLVICRDDREAKGITREQFVRAIPQPPDVAIEALREALISFFPSGQTSHRREVLVKFDEMAVKTNEMANLKMKRVMDDPKLMAKLEAKADRVADEEIGKLLQ